MTRLGIDLGASAMRCAALDAQGAPVLVPDGATGAFETPPFVAIDGESAIVGAVARNLGGSTGDERAFEPIDQLGGPGGATAVDPEGRAWSAAALASVLLRKAERDARTHLDADVTRTVIAVEVDADESVRQAIRTAASIAELADVTLVERPVAIATHALAGRGRHLVLDIGTSGARAAVVDAVDSDWVVLGHVHATECGGSALDRRITAILLGIEAPSAAELGLAEQLKIDLLQSGTHGVRRSALINGRVRRVAVARAQLDRVLAPLLDDVAQLCTDALEVGGVDAATVSSVVVAGRGATWPGLDEAIARQLQSPDLELVRLQPENSVAFGAARLAGRASSADSSGERPNLANGVPYDIGVRVWDAEQGEAGLEVVIARGACIPTTSSTTIYTKSSDQRRVVVDIVRAQEGGSPTSIGRFAFGPIRRPRTNLPVEVEITFDVDGALLAVARSRETGERIDCEFSEDEAPAALAAAARALRIE